MIFLLVAQLWLPQAAYVMGQRSMFCIPTTAADKRCTQDATYAEYTSGSLYVGIMTIFGVSSLNDTEPGATLHTAMMQCRTSMSDPTCLEPA